MTTCGLEAVLIGAIAILYFEMAFVLMFPGLVRKIFGGTQ